MTALAMLAMAQPDGFHRNGNHATSELVTGIPLATVNGVISTARNPDPDEIADFATSQRLESVAWSVQVRGEHVDERIVATATGHGLRQRMTLPFMLKGLGESDLGESDSDGLAVRRVSGGESDLYRKALAAGFEAPEEIFRAFTVPAVMDHTSMRGYIAEVDGVPVATAFCVLLNDLVGVFNISVPSLHRRRGYGRAVTAAALRDAREAGARTAFLHASQLGFSVYKALGFRLVENWTLLIP